MTEWGEDPTKWVLKKSAFDRGWVLFPPNDGEASWHRTFDEARAVVAQLDGTDTP